MDLSSIIGFISGAVFLVLSILITAKFNLSQASTSFIDAPSVMIVIGGALASTFIGYPLGKLIRAAKGAKVVFAPPKTDPLAVIEQIRQLSALSRKEGVLALDSHIGSLNDEFLEKGLKLIVDATDPELVRSIMETEMSYIENRRNEERAVWEFLGGQAPSWGMIGTLIGLVLMLKNMGDITTIGPNMAVALITTFYGSLLANFVANPIGNKMKIYMTEEILIKEMQIEGMLSIQAGENTRIIEEKLKVFLSPELVKHDSAGAGE